MRRRDVDLLDLNWTYWVPTVLAPERDWVAARGCREGARFIVNSRTFQASQDDFEPFDSRLGCLQWVMSHRERLNRCFPGATIRVVPLDRWLLGLE